VGSCDVGGAWTLLANGPGRPRVTGPVGTGTPVRLLRAFNKLVPRYPATARVAVVLGFAGGSVGVVLAGVRWGGVAGIRELWWWPDAPAGITRVGLHVNEVLDTTAQGLLLVSWVALGVLIRRGVAAVATVVWAAAAGGLPLLLGAPLFSNDAYTYVAVGSVLDHRLDPYRVGWGVLRDTSYAAHVDHTWQHTPTPYSPVVLRVLQLDAHAVHGHLLPGVLLLRAAAVLGLLALGGAVAWAAGPRPGAVATGLWVAVANPLMAQHLLSGVHIDLSIAVLVVLAVTFHARGHPVAATALVVLAAQVKITAAVVLLVLAADLAAGRTGRHRWVRGAPVLLGGAAAFTAISVGTGLGFGWLTALSVPGRGGNSMTPVNAVADLAHRVGLGVRPLTNHVVSAPAGLRAASLLVGAAVVAWSVLAVRRLGVPLAAAASLAALATFGTATWPWYFAPVLALVAVAGPSRRVLTAATLGSVVLAITLKPGSEPLLPHAPVLGDVATLALLAGIVAILTRVGAGPAPGARQPRDRRQLSSRRDPSRRRWRQPRVADA